MIGAATDALKRRQPPTEDERLKILRITLIALAIALSMLGWLVWFMPARLALAACASRLHGAQLEQVGGSVWHGRAGHVYAADGTDLGRVRWTLSRRALLGDVRLHLELDRPGLAASGNIHRLAAGASEWTGVHIEADAALLDGLPGLEGNRLHGRLDVHIVDARLQGFWPMKLDAAAHWKGAAVSDSGLSVVLGDFDLQAHGQGGIVGLRLNDDRRGPLRAEGEAQLSPLAWRYRIDLQPRTTDPALHRWLARFGRPAPDGVLHLRGSGGLTRWMSHTER